MPQPNEVKMIKVYSNCEQVELFVNGKSFGLKKRNSQDFPAAGLRWNVVLNKGINNIKAIGKQGKTKLVDELVFTYQPDKWRKPAKLLIEKLKEENGVITIQAKLLDEKNIQCLDAANWIQFGLIGDGKLIDNLGTSSGARKVQLYNGRAIIQVQTNNGRSVLSAKVDTVPVEFINL